VDVETGKRGRDRRRHPRFNDDAQAICLTQAGEGGFQQARLTELSMDGMRLSCPRAFEAGSHVYAGVFLEEAQEPLVVVGVVQHCDVAADGATVGLQFLSVSEEQRAGLARLAAYLKQRHGASALVTVRAAPAIKRIDEERWW
jgi:hypothetical protein